MFLSKFSSRQAVHCPIFGSPKNFGESQLPTYEDVMRCCLEVRRCKGLDGGGEKRAIFCIHCGRRGWKNPYIIRWGFDSNCLCYAGNSNVTRPSHGIGQKWKISGGIWTDVQDCKPRLMSLKQQLSSFLILRLANVPTLTNANVSKRSKSLS